MKKLILGILFLVASVSVFAQNLTTHREYYDWFQTKIKHKWTTRPDGKLHGDYITYRENGSVYCIENYNNGTYSSFKHLFLDGSISSTGKLIVRSDRSSSSTCKEYSLYLLSNSGKRVLRMQSKLYKLVAPDSLGEDYVIHRDLGSWRSLSCWLYDHRLASYDEYHPNGQVKMRFSTSPDKNLETIMQYDENGKLLSHQVYNVKEQKLSQIYSNKKGNLYTLVNNIVTLNTDIEAVKENGFMYSYKAGSTFYNDISLHLSRKEFYDKILSCSLDDCTKNSVVQVDLPYYIDIKTVLDGLKEKEVNKEIVGRSLSMILYWPNNYHTTFTNYILNIDPENPQLFSRIGENPQDYHLKATYEQDSLIYLDLLDKKGGYSYQGAIKNQKPEGEVYIQCPENGEWSSWIDTWHVTYQDGKMIGEGQLERLNKNTQERTVYKGSFANNLYEGMGELVVYNSDGSEEARYSGLFNQGYLTEGKSIDHQGVVNEGTWKNNNFDTGVVIEPFNESDTLYTYYANGSKNHHSIYKAGKTGASFESLTELSREKPGQGIYIDPNKNRYEGLFISNKMVFGKLSPTYFVKGSMDVTLKDGSRYKGKCCQTGLEWETVVYDEEGRLDMPNGDYYEGVFEKGKFAGTGNVRITYENKKIYEGKLVKNLPNGTGKYIYPSGNILSGNFQSGVPVDKCEIQYTNGDLYQGFVVNEMPHGEGTYTYQNGDIHIGQWIQGVKDGMGKLTTKTNVIYEGVWSSGKPNGNITVISGKNIYNLIYKDGVIGKTAQIQFENGDKFSGTIENGDYKSGDYTFADGMIYSGSWQNGKPAKVKVMDPQGNKLNTKNGYEYRKIRGFDKQILAIY